MRLVLRYARDELTYVYISKENYHQACELFTIFSSEKNKKVMIKNIQINFAVF